MHNIANNFVASPKFSGNLSFPLLSAVESMDHPAKERSTLLVKTKIRRGREYTSLALHTECNVLYVNHYQNNSFQAALLSTVSKKHIIGQVEKTKNKTKRKNHEGPGNQMFIGLHIYML